MQGVCFNCFHYAPEGQPCPYCGYDPRGSIGKYRLALQPGTILANRYLVGRVLGQGGFGITYVALDNETKSRVAIKEYMPTDFAFRDEGTIGLKLNSEDLQDDFAFGRQQFLAEAETLAEFVGNEHIIAIRDRFEANGTAYFAMEFAEGVDLKRYMELRGGPLRICEANRILLPIMEALQWVHSKGIVHRDISPDNIMIRSDGNAKLIDFGAARYSTGEKSKSLDVVLKHGFAPMEQYSRRGRQGPFTDVYAMAATYYYAITGKVPPDAVDRMAEDELQPPGNLGVNIKEDTEQALLKALALNAADRWQTMAAFYSALLATMPQPFEPGAGEGTGTVKKPAEKTTVGTDPVKSANLNTGRRTAGYTQREKPLPAQEKKAENKKPKAVYAGVIVLLLALLIGGAVILKQARNKRTMEDAGTETSASVPAADQQQAQFNANNDATASIYRPGAEILLAGTDTRSSCDVEDWTDIKEIYAAPGTTLGIRSDGTAVAVGCNAYGQCEVGDWTDLTSISGNWSHSVGLRSDGTVVAVGNGFDGRCNVQDWSDIVDVAAGGWFTIGLKKDGTAVITGDLDVSTWTDITDVSAGNNFAIGLRSNGTVVAVGSDEFHQCTDVADWKNVVAIDAKGWHAVGLCKDGTVVGSGATGGNRRKTEDWTGITAVSAGYYSTVGQRKDGSLIATGWNYFGEDEVGDWSDIVQFSSGEYCTVGLHSDGTVIARGRGGVDFTEAAEWSGMAKIAAGYNFIAGLRENGTVVASGAIDNGQELVSEWRDIQDIAAGHFHTVGLTKDGTVLIQGRNAYSMNQAASAWTEITAVTAGRDYTVGLRKDGTVVAAGQNGAGQCNVSTWTDISAISAGVQHTLGLRKDGTVVATGLNNCGQCNVSDWRNIIAIAAGEAFSVGLQSDGTVVTAGTNNYGDCDVDNWTDIVMIAAGMYHTVGLKADGTLVATGINFDGQCNLDGWNDVTQISAGGFYTAARRGNHVVDLSSQIEDEKDDTNSADNSGSTLIGSIITFGRYEQDNNRGNGAEPIEWLVLDERGGKLLVVSRLGLDTRPYHETGDSVTWEECSLRAWLNDGFLNAAFSEEEQAQIPKTMVMADKNPQYYSNPGTATQDQVFLLSITEGRNYLGSEDARKCELTEYANAMGGQAYNGRCCWWWMRTPGYFSDHAAYTTDTGSINNSGLRVDYDTIVVRPALWINWKP